MAKRNLTSRHFSVFAKKSQHDRGVTAGYGQCTQHGWKPYSLFRKLLLESSGGMRTKKKVITDLCSKVIWS